MLVVTCDYEINDMKCNMAKVCRLNIYWMWFAFGCLGGRGTTTSDCGSMSDNYYSICECIHELLVLWNGRVDIQIIGLTAILKLQGCLSSLC